MAESTALSELEQLEKEIELEFEKEIKYISDYINNIDETFKQDYILRKAIITIQQLVDYKTNMLKVTPELISSISDFEKCIDNHKDITFNTGSSFNIKNFITYQVKYENKCKTENEKLKINELMEKFILDLYRYNSLKNKLSNLTKEDFTKLCGYIQYHNEVFEMLKNNKSGSISIFTNGSNTKISNMLCLYKQDKGECWRMFRNGHTNSFPGVDYFKYPTVLTIEEVEPVLDKIDILKQRWSDLVIEIKKIIEEEKIIEESKDKDAAMWRKYKHLINENLLTD
jgi:hypothetical protein